MVSTSSKLHTLPKQRFKVGLIFLILIFGIGFATAHWYGDFIYDEINDSSIDTTLWSQENISLTGSSVSTWTEDATYMRSQGDNNGAGTYTIWLNTSNLLDYDLLENVTFQAVLYADFSGSGSADECSTSNLTVFGTLIKSVNRCATTGSSTDNSVWQIIENDSQGEDAFTALDDGVVSVTFNATNNRIYQESFGSASGETVISRGDIYNMYYTGNNSGVTLNSPANNSQRLTENIIQFNFTIYDPQNISSFQFKVDGDEVENITTTNSTYIYEKNWTINTTGNHNYSINTCGSDDVCHEEVFNISISQITINMYDTEGNLVDEGYISAYATNLSTTFTENPLVRSGLTFLENKATNWILFNITDTSGNLTSYYDTITFWENTSEYNITLEQKQLELYFWHYNGSTANTTGFYSDGNITESFQDVSFIKILTNLLQGKVKVFFSWNQSLLNYTQYYEFDNDWVTHTEENLTVMNNTDTSAFIKIIDTSGNPIDDALVRIAYSLPAVGGEYQEIGQRFTGSDGISGTTFFWFDINSHVSVRVTKDGYTAQTQTVDMGANTFTLANPMVITLRREESVVHKGVFVRSYNWYNTNMTIIPLSVYAPSRNTVKFNTDYRAGNGLGNVSITLDQYKKGITNLTRGTDYCSSCTDNLVLTIYVDDTYWGNLTIPYQSIIEDKFVTPTGLSDDTVGKMAWVLLILIVAVLGIVIKENEENEGAGSMGKSLFLIGCLIIGLIFPTKFWYLLVVVLFWGMGTYLRRFIGE